MSHAFQRAMSEIFDQGAEIRLSVEEEATAIVGAKVGHGPAVIALLFAYSAALRNAVRRYRDALPVEDARSLAVAGLLEAVHAYDPARCERLAGLVADTVGRSLAEGAAAESSSWSIPERTLQRWYSIMRTADGDVAAALELAQDKGMSREVFLDILAVLRQTGSLDVEFHGSAEGEHGRDLDARSLWGDANAFAAAEDRVMTEIALGAVEGLEEVVTRLAYGFATGEPLSDSAIVSAMADEILGEEAALAGQTVVSRATVQRTRASALRHMRDALGI